MRKSIAALEKVGHIRQIHDGWWLFKALLAPKPHREHVCNIDDFIWRFCVNYIPLNQVTLLTAYPIPRCDTSVEEAFGGRWIWLYDAPMGYHQMAVSLETQEKLAFQGPDAIKWTYTVMPFVLEEKAQQYPSQPLVRIKHTSLLDVRRRCLRWTTPETCYSCCCKKMIILRVGGCSRELSSRSLAIDFESLERSNIWIFRDLNSEFESFE